MSGLGPGQRLTQEITYWPPESRKNDYNETRFGEPILLKGFWNETFVEVVTSTGENIVAKAVVHVNQDVQSDGWMAKGDRTQDPIYDPTEYIFEDGVSAHKVRDFQKATDIRNMDYDRIAIL